MKNPFTRSVAWRCEMLESDLGAVRVCTDVLGEGYRFQCEAKCLLRREIGSPIDSRAAEKVSMTDTSEVLPDGLPACVDVKGGLCTFAEARLTLVGRTIGQQPGSLSIVC